MNENVCLLHVVGNIWVQNDYNYSLEEDDKWEIVYDTLKGKVGVYGWPNIL